MKYKSDKMVTLVDALIVITDLLKRGDSYIPLELLVYKFEQTTFPAKLGDFCIIDEIPGSKDEILFTGTEDECEGRLDFFINHDHDAYIQESCGIDGRLPFSDCYVPNRSK